MTNTTSRYPLSDAESVAAVGLVLRLTAAPTVFAPVELAGLRELLDRLVAIGWVEIDERPTAPVRLTPAGQQARLAALAAASDALARWSCFPR